MASSIPLLLLLLLFFPSVAAAFDITKILSQFPDEFSTLSHLLTQSNLAAAINSRQTITLLAPDNSALSSSGDLPADALKKVLSLHVILDYYDDAKLRQLPNNTAILTTLFQASGDAIGQSGFLNATVHGGGDGAKIAFGSAVPGSPLNADFVKVVATQPYNISVLQISSVIVPPGIAGCVGSPSTSPSPAPKAASAAPAPSKGGASPKPPKSPSPAASGSAPAEAPATDGSSAPASAEAPVTDGSSAPAPAEAPGTDGSSAPALAPVAADGANAPGPAAEDDDKGSSAAAPGIVGSCLAVGFGATVLWAMF